MIPVIYNFKTQYAGDTFLGLNLTLKNENNLPIDITGYFFKLQIKSNSKGITIKELTSLSGISIVNATEGKFKIDSFINPVVCGNHVYDLQVTYPNGNVDTYIRGLYSIVSDITR
jgi:hypothetical protein